ncbi:MULTISPECIES: GNAT family N-acetyltransferase [Idiomarina]|jgi:ElaA protein|uniref:Acetyltransferase n=1 Tax=Idiomarina zobellii TaxID=86103 RepID=A0A837NIA1_9GAMM|nr:MULTISPECIES: GNAT family N-acetyltransferase [Idiomarina]KPD24085.1 acetyltransferase [Idiomarina zobellii]SDF80857.1 ElaA protein [Idiomarina zobellii]|tara:strand:- start:11919 stop:12371 length:453 start_codon:yes stop_codon:yes gene_type:complete
MNWHLKAFNDLSLHDLYDLLKLRQEVFVVEQTCPYLDADGADEQALHLYARNSAGEMIAYARLYQATADTGYSRIGRVLTHEKVRRQKLGIELMQRSIDYLEKYAPQAPIRVGAQVYLLDFYKSFGFEPISEEYLEDDIPHIDMQRKAAQ